jgi:hypothetical protein
VAAELAILMDIAQRNITFIALSVLLLQQIMAKVDS